MKAPQNLVAEVGAVVQKHEALTALCGEILATLESNVRLGRLRTDNEDQFAAMRAAWSQRFANSRSRAGGRG